MSNEFYTILTDAGLAAIANASISSSTVNFSKVLVGDGNGAYYTLTKEMTALRNKKWEGQVASVEIDPNNPNWVSVEAVIPATEGGFYIREIGISNEKGVLLAIGKLPETYKPALDSGSTKDLYLRAIFEVSNTSAITLRTDPSVVLATRKYVEDKVGNIVVPGIVDNLNSTATDKGLSAKQGKVLNDKHTQLASSFDNWQNTEYTSTKAKLTQHLAQYEYQTAIISGTQIRLAKQSNSNRLLFKLNSFLSGSITVSTDAGVTSKNLVDFDGNPVTSLEKGFHEIVLTGNFFILRNRGLSPTDLQALITITNEAEVNESVLRINYANAIMAADASINLPANASWNDILLQIPNINAGNPKMVTGYGISGASAMYFNQLSGSGTNNNSYPFEISFPIGFIPKIIIIRETTNYSASITMEDTQSGNMSTQVFSGSPSITSTSNLGYLSTVGNAYISENGFRLPVRRPNQNHIWIAIE